MVGAIVHEWLEPHGGAEKVMEEIADIFPDAPITCLWDDAPGRFESGRVRETWLAGTPLRRSKSLALAAMPMTWRHLPAAEADWVLCSSHLFAHHARFGGPARKAPKFVYAYTPARYIWNPELDERGNSPVVRAASVPLRRLDRHRAQEAHSIAAISTFVQMRIQKSWDRDSTVIYPPVNVESFLSDHVVLTADEEAILGSLPESYVLGASRFIPYKRLDLVIKLGLANDVPVVLAGGGPEEAALKALAGEHPGHVTFVASPSHGLLRAMYSRALAYVFPPVEDFGIMPVEAMATGTPVIALNVGGAAETTVDGVTGALIESFTPANMQDALQRAVGLRGPACVEQAWKFDRKVFQQQMSQWILSA